MATRSVDRSTEEQCEKIRVIDSWEVLGYRGLGREEHSGENAPIPPCDLFAELADNRREQLIRRR